ncbi:MAG: YidC/Oxa1 family membrane protein insertase [Armatimonadota bacterium]
MAKAQPGKKLPPTFWVLWLGSLVLLIVMQKNQPVDKTTFEQVYKDLQKANIETKDVTAASLKGKYEGLLDKAVNEKKLTQAEADDKKHEAAILVANTEFRAGLMRNETQRLRTAFQTLWPFEKKLKDTPEWSGKTFTSAPDSRFPAVPQTASGQQLFFTLRDTISERNKHELIWGFIPFGYQMIDGLVHMTGAVPSFSYAFGAFLLALVVRLIVFPFTQKTIMHSRMMSQLAPLTKDLKEKYGNDAQQLQIKTMELYKEYGLNPMAGCVPAFVQMPLFLSVYQCMLLYQFEFQKGNFLWINEATSKATNGFIAPNLGAQDAILIIIYGITMVISQFLTPVSDPSQVKQMRLMGIGISVMFTVFMFTGAFPVVSGFVLYWTFTNILATFQSLRAYRLPLPPLQKVNTIHGGAVPNDTPFGKWLKNMTPPAPGSTSEATPKNTKPGGKTDIKTSTKTGKPQQHKPKK